MEHNRQLREQLERVEQTLLTRPRAQLRSEARMVEEVAWREFGGSARVERAVNEDRRPPSIQIGLLLCRTAQRLGWNRADQAAACRMVAAFRAHRLAN